MRSRLLLTGSILLCAILVAGCTSPTGLHTPSPDARTASVTANPTFTPDKTIFTIHASPEKYSPIMSSAVGIRLTPDYTASVPVSYNWTANYGTFISWNATEGNVTIGNQSLRTTDPSIYWSYPPEDMGREKPPVTVRLVIESERLIHGGGGGRGTIAWSEIRIGWEKNDTAVAGP